MYQRSAIKTVCRNEEMDIMDMIKRPRRLRGGEYLRRMVRETRMDKSSLIYPMFVQEGTGKEDEIPSMPGQFRYSLDRLPYELERLSNAGVGSVMLFGIPDVKDEAASQAYAADGIVQRALEAGKKQFPNLYYITDVCLCEYTSHGHCGMLCGHEVENDSTLKLLAQTALSHVQAGADMVAPSDMMDGRVLAIRNELDKYGHKETPIMSYAVKYASAFYGPFREAADSAPAFGDRKSYQMDPHNSREGVKEALLDVEEGADIVMVKPALSYLDMITKVKDVTNLPVAAYSVSGEYAMVKAAAQKGWIDEERIMCEMAVSTYRAGAQIYLTYYAKELAKCMDEGRIG
jgi:porphobilinogen synthase